MSELAYEMDDAIDALKNRLTPGYFFSDFLRSAELTLWERLLNTDASGAVQSGAYRTKRDYFEALLGERLRMANVGIPVFENEPMSVAGQVLERLLMLHSYDGSSGEEELTTVLSELEPALKQPDYCAQALAKRSFHSVSTAALLRDANELMEDCRIAEDNGELDEMDRASMQNLARWLENSRDTLRNSWGYLRHLHDLAQVKERHSLFTTKYALCLPGHFYRSILDPIDILIAESRKNPKLLFNISPRNFERLVAQIFKGFGFTVDLTAQTRDGGVDILCMSNESESTIKLALEVKRYREDRPITVELVRSFVGANAVLRSEKLIYVTTSRYTKEAIRYARSPFLANLLELKALPDVIRWCNEYSMEKFDGDTK
jgi:hypothetical protein